MYFPDNYFPPEYFPREFFLTRRRGGPGGGGGRRTSYGGHEDEELLRRVREHWEEIEAEARRLEGVAELELLAHAACELLDVEGDAAQGALWLMEMLPEEAEGWQRLLAAVYILAELISDD